MGSLRRAVCALASTLVLATCIDESTTRPCTDDDRCLPGYQCIAKVCQPCDFDQCPASQVTLVSTGGGLACGPDGTCVRFPAGSLASLTEIEIARTDNPVNFIGATTISRVYAIRPAGLTPLEPVEIVMAVSRRIEEGTGNVMILRALGPRGPWESLDTTRETTRASAYSPLLGLFVLARDSNGMTTRDAGVSPDAEGSAFPDATTGFPDATSTGVDPVMGIGMPVAVPGPLTSLHGLAWDSQQQSMLLSDTDSGFVLGFPHTGATPMTTPTTVRQMSNGTYGLVVDATGRIVMMERTTRQISAQIGMATAAPLIPNFNGQAFNSPVDAAVRSDGTIYFTDPAVGLNGRPREIQFNGIFRRSAAGVVTAEEQGGLDTEPRGIELSPDETTLYVVDGAMRVVRGWTVRGDGSLTDARIVASTAAAPDGIAVDREGNIYVGTGAGVEVFAPDGRRWGNVATMGAIGGLAFGGPGLAFLYATSPTTMYYMAVTIPGAR